MANCVRQPRHWPATVSRRSADAAGRCSPSSRRALTAPPPGARPRPFPAPARARARRRWHRVPSGPTRASSSRQRTTPAVFSRPVRGPRDSDENAESKGFQIRLEGESAGEARRAAMRRVRIGTTAMAGMRRDAGNDTGARGETDPATQPQGPPTGASGGICATTRGDRAGGDNGWTGRVGRGLADRCLRTRPGCARRSTSLPGGKPARDSHGGNAATRTIPKQVTVPGTGVTNSRRL